MLQFKVGVHLKGLVPQMLVALQVVEEEFAKMGLDTVVTSGNDSTHKQGSKHYSGEALDFRTKHAPGIAKGIVLGIQKRLTPLGFDVLYEYVGLPEEHCHCEWDPKY